MSAPSPQQARAIASRKALIVATVEILAERGRDGATTAAVAKRAGLSQGALFRHFPTKAALMGAAAEQILAGLFDDFLAALPAALTAPDPVEAGVQALWVVYQDPRLAGLFELLLAARCDPDLQQQLQGPLRAHADRERAFARTLFPEAAARPDFDAVVTGLLSTLQGAAVAAGALPGEAGHLELRFIAEQIQRALGPPALGGGAP
jgi:AcrR family transcriptional regulator